MNYLVLTLAGLLSLVSFFSSSALAQPVGSLGTLHVGSYQSSATGTLTGLYVPGAALPTIIAYYNDTPDGQDSLVFTAQVLGNGYVQGLEHFAGRPEAVAAFASRSYPLGVIPLPGPGSYLVQVAAFTFDRQTQKWTNGPVRVYWLFPLANPLPVELVSFAAAAAKDSVTVGWETASEVSCDYFELQRSTNGTTWYPRTRPAGHGTTASTHRYRYTEAQLLVRVYYRLRQVDSGGAERFSPVVVLAPKPLAVAIAPVYPNPAHEQAQLTAPSGVLVRFYDSAGRQRRQQTLDDTGTLDLRGLPAGSYHLVVGDGPHPTRTRLIVF